MTASWSDIPVWEFCPVDTSLPTSRRYTVKVVDSVTDPLVADKRRDGQMVVRILVNPESKKLVGYSFTFLNEPKVAEFDYSLAASYGEPDTDDMLLVIGSAHVRAIRYGTDNPTYHVVLRHK